MFVSLHQICMSFVSSLRASLLVFSNQKKCTFFSYFHRSFEKQKKRLVNKQTTNKLWNCILIRSLRFITWILSLRLLNISNEYAAKLKLGKRSIVWVENKTKMKIHKKIVVVIRFKTLITRPMFANEVIFLLNFVCCSRTHELF